MQKKLPKRRGRPPQFVRDDEGRVIYGLSAQTVTLRGRKRTRFYATFDDPVTKTRKWLGIDDLNGAFIGLLAWLQTNGLLLDYFHKVGQDHLIPKFLSEWRAFEDQEYQMKPEADVPEWLQGQSVSGIPLRVSSLAVFPLSRQTMLRETTKPEVLAIIKLAGFDNVHEYARLILAETLTGLIFPARSVCDAAIVGRTQLASIAKATKDTGWRQFTDAELDKLIAGCIAVASVDGRRRGVR